MGAVIETDGGWVPPLPEECAEADTLTIPLPDGGETERVKIRLVNLLGTDELAEFALIQQTYHQGKWRTVAEVDSAHGDEVHEHRWSRKTDGRVGNPEQLIAVSSLGDVADGYELGYQEIVVKWVENKRRWHDA